MWRQAKVQWEENTIWSDCIRDYESDDWESWGQFLRGDCKELPFYPVAATVMQATEQRISRFHNLEEKHTSGLSTSWIDNNRFSKNKTETLLWVETTAV